jgi:hypothetical protein
MSHLWLTILICAILWPGLVWAISYLLLVREFRAWNLLPVRIHETGKYNFLETTFYFNHFLRELPIDTLFGLAILWSYFSAGLSLRVDSGVRVAAAACLMIFLVVVSVGSLRKAGWRDTAADLLQFRERDEIRRWGSHWHMHFLSTLALLVVFILPGILYSRGPLLLRELTLLLGVFAGISLVLGTDRKALQHKRWLLHGARELFTYVVLAAPAAFAPFLLLALAARPAPGAPGYAAIGVLVLISGYFLLSYRRGDLGREAQSDRGFVYLICSHFFEHFLDCIYILLLILLGVALFGGA